MDEKAGSKLTERLKNIFEILAGFGVVVGAFYSAGLLILALQLAWTYGLNFSSTWYAATIVPRPIVLGQGLRFGLLDWSMLAFLFVISISGYNGDRYVDRATGIPITEGQSNNSTPLKLIWFGSVGFERQVVMCLLALVFGPFVVRLVFGLYNALHGASYDPVISAFGLLADLLLIVGGMILARNVINKNRQVGTPFITGAAQIFALFYAVVFLSALIKGDLKEPPLSPIEIRGNSQFKVKGRLLSHQDGYWHIIRDNGEIVAISDDTAKVTTIPKP